MRIRDHVETILRDFEYTRNCDKKLILKYWETIDKIPMGNINEFVNGFIVESTSTESIRRARQLIQEEGKYLPTDEVVLTRRWKQRAMRNAIVDRREVV